MYQLVSARYKVDRRSGRWVEADLSTAPITGLTAYYADVWLFVTYPSLTVPKALRLSDFSNLLNGISSTMTVQEWLAHMGNTTLPWNENPPSFEERLVEYAQAWHAGYEIQAQGRSGVVDDELAKSHRQDLVLTHPSYDSLYINQHCLFTVNGYFHLSDADENSVRIIDGNTTVRKTNDNQIGIYSFEQIGPIKTCPIKADMVTAMNDQSPLWDGAYVTLPADINLDEKTVLLVVGGFLQVLGKTYKRVGDRTWKVELGNIIFLDRFIQSLKDMDLSSLNIEAPDNNPTFALTAKLKSDEAVRAYMTLSQSFMVIVDSPSLFQEYIPLESSGLSHRYLSPVNEQLPVVGAYGRMLDYHLIEEDGTYVYCCSSNWRHNYDAGHRKWATMNAVDGGRYPSHPYKEATAFIRRLGSEY